MSMDVSSMKVELKKPCVPVVKVWANPVRSLSTKWPLAAILKNRMGYSQVTICVRNYCDTCFIVSR